MTIEEIREKFKKETGEEVYNGNGEYNWKYGMWLEENLSLISENEISDEERICLEYAKGDPCPSFHEKGINVCDSCVAKIQIR